MADRLSQDELDALLKATNPEPPKEAVTLESILQLSDRRTQWLVRDVVHWDLVRILSAAGEEVREKILRNVSARRRALLREDLQLGHSSNPERVEKIRSRMVREIDAWIESGNSADDEPEEDSQTLVERLEQIDEKGKGQRRSDRATVTGMALILLAVPGGMYLEEILFHPGTALLFVALGILAATWIASGSGAMGQMVKLVGRAFTHRLLPGAEWIAYLLHCTQLARKNGILALGLDAHIDRVSDPSLRLWLKLAVDGCEPQLIEALARNDIVGMEDRHRSGQNLLAAAGFGSVLFGLLGLGIGLMLLPAEKIAATLILPGWGLLGGVFCYALCRRLQRQSAVEARQRRLMVAGVMAIQDGEHPHIIRQRLEAFLEEPLLPGELEKYAEFPDVLVDSQEEKGDEDADDIFVEEVDDHRKGNDEDIFIEETEDDIEIEETDFLEALLQTEETEASGKEEDKNGSDGEQEKEQELDPLAEAMLAMMGDAEEKPPPAAETTADSAENALFAAKDLFSEEGETAGNRPEESRHKNPPAAPAPTTPFDEPVSALLATPAGVLFAGAAGKGLFRSYDGGERWFDTDLMDRPITALVLVGSTLYAGASDVERSTTGGLYRSRDGGHRWEKVDRNTGVQIVTAFGEILYAGADGLLCSVDGGDVWYQTGEGLDGEVRDLLVADESLYAATSTGVFRSRDRGATWVTASLSGTGIYALALQESTLYAGAENDLYHSTNSGETWVGMGLTGATVRSLLVAADSLYAGTGEGVFVSRDAGSTWKRLDMGSTDVFTLAVSGRRVYAGTGEGLL